MQKYLNGDDLDIAQTLRNSLFWKREHFTVLISDPCSKGPLNLRSEQGPKLNRRMMERRNSFI